MKLAGTPLPHESADGHVTGAALYTDDLVGFSGALRDLARIPRTRRGYVAHALVRAVSRLFSTRWSHVDSVSALGVARSGDAARTSARATSSATNVCEKCGLAACGRSPAHLERQAKPPVPPSEIGSFEAWWDRLSACLDFCHGLLGSVR